MIMEIERDIKYIGFTYYTSLQKKEKEFTASSEVQRLTNFLFFFITSSHSGGNDISQPIILNEFKVFCRKSRQSCSSQPFYLSRLLNKY
jgi:hypothetical protein